MMAKIEGQEELPGTRTANGRKDQGGTAKPIKLKPLRDVLADLMKAKAARDRATAKLNSAVKEAAEASNLNVAAIKALMAGQQSAKKFGQLKDQADQTALLFSEFKGPKAEQATDTDAPATGGNGTDEVKH